MPDHTPEEKAKNKAKKSKKDSGGIGAMLRRTILPGQLAKDLFKDVDKKLKKATGKK